MLPKINSYKLNYVIFAKRQMTGSKLICIFIIYFYYQVDVIYLFNYLSKKITIFVTLLDRM